MKVRAIRCHQTGLSNRFDTEEKAFESSKRTYSLMDSSAAKFLNSGNSLNKTGAGTKLLRSTVASINNNKYSNSLRETLTMGPVRKTNIFTSQQRNIQSVHQGQDMQLQNPRFDTAYFRKNESAISYDDSKPVPNLVQPLEATLNKEVKEIRNHFQGKDINMHKITEIKRAFLQNFSKKHDIKPYYKKYVKSDGNLDKNGIRGLIKDFGFYATDDEIALMMSLAKNRIDDGSSATIQDFITLISKPNIYFQTLKLKDHKQLQEKPCVLPQRVHVVLRNSFLRLREAMRIYDQQGIPLTQSQFHKIFKKLDLSDLVISNQQINELYKQFKNSSNDTVNQEKFLGAIAEQQNLNILKKKRAVDIEFEANLTRHHEINAFLDQKKGVSDLKRLSNPDYELQLKKVRGMVVAMKKIWTNKNEFQKVLKNGKSQESTINRKELRENIEKIMQKAGLNYSKKEYDALMACFKYNVESLTRYSDVITTLYDESQQAFDDRMDRRCRDLPPNITYESTSKLEPSYNSEILQQGLAKIDSKCLHNQFVKTFNNLDTDKDGYVSVKDFQTAIQKKYILSAQEMDNVINYLDQDRKGYLNFQQLQEKLHPNIVNQMKRITFPNLLPKFNSKDKLLQTKKNLIAQANKREYNVPTKYSAWPKRLTTTDLSLLQPIQRSALYMTQRDRFNYREKESVGTEDKKRCQSIINSKILKRSMWEDRIQQRVDQLREEELKKGQQVNHLKRLAKEIYQQNTHKQQ